MKHEHEPDPDVVRVWQAQEREEAPMPLPELGARVAKLGRTTRRRNYVEYVAGIVVLILFGRRAVDSDLHTLIRVGAGLIMGATIFAVAYLHQRGWMPRGTVEDASVEFLRAELRRQRDLRAGVWWWYLLPFVPGILFMLIGFAAASSEHAVRPAIAGVFSVLVFLSVGWWNVRKAKKIERDIDALG